MPLLGLPFHIPCVAVVQSLRVATTAFFVPQFPPPPRLCIRCLCLARAGAASRRFTVPCSLPHRVTRVPLSGPLRSVRALLSPPLLFSTPLLSSAPSRPSPRLCPLAPGCARHRRARRPRQRASSSRAAAGRLPPLAFASRDRPRGLPGRSAAAGEVCVRPRARGGPRDLRDSPRPTRLACVGLRPGRRAPPAPRRKSPQDARRACLDGGGALQRAQEERAHSCRPSSARVAFRRPEAARARRPGPGAETAASRSPAPPTLARPSPPFPPFGLWRLACFLAHAGPLRARWDAAPLRLHGFGKRRDAHRHLATRRTLRTRRCRA